MEERLAGQALQLASIARAENATLMLFLGELAGRLAAGQRDPSSALRALFSDASAGSERIAARSDGTPENEAMLTIMDQLRGKAEQTLATQLRLQAQQRARRRPVLDADEEP